MKAIRIKAFPKTKSQVKTKEGIDFELVDEADLQAF